MLQTPQIEPITTMARNHKRLLEKAESGPIFLTQRSRPVAVLVNHQEWEQLAKRMEALELERDLLLSNERYERMKHEPGYAVGEDALEEALAEAGLS